jgi:hypothetical protein
MDVKYQLEDWLADWEETLRQSLTLPRERENDAIHALDLFTDTAGAESPLQRQSTQWISLDRLIKIRNRVTHPKGTDDLLLTDDDLAAVERAADVVLYLFLESLDRNSRALTKRWREFQQALARRRRA